MTKKIFLIAGEASGDFLGAELMQGLKTVVVEPVEFSGVGGPQMTSQGLYSLFPMNDLSVMGLAEVLQHLPRLIKRINQTVDAILELKPNVVITIDAPDFCFRVAKKVKQRNPSIKIVHMVAPTVWAWRPGRAKKIAQFLDGLLCLFPFEPPYFTPHGLKTQFMGHPLEKSIKPISDHAKQVFCRDYNLDQTKPILCLLPGSRSGEIDKLLPLFLYAVKRLKAHNPDLQIILPTLANKFDKIKSAVPSDIHVFVPSDNSEKYVAFAASAVALHASGTVALELALCGTPMVTTYKFSALTAFVARRMVKTPHANLVNVLLNHPVAPELIQEKSTIDNLTNVTFGLLNNEALRQLQKDQLQAIRTSLKENAPFEAARFVQSFL